MHTVKVFLPPLGMGRAVELPVGDPATAEKIFDYLASKGLRVDLIIREEHIKQAGLLAT